MLSVEKVATPPTAATVVVPDSDAPAVPFPVVSATVTAPVNAVTTFPSESSWLTCTAGEIAVPATAVPGCTVKASRDAPPGRMLKAWLVAVRLPVDACSRYPVPTLSMLRSANVATPSTADCVVVPCNVPLPGLVLMASVTGSAKVETVLPDASCAVTRTGASVAPAVLVCGWAVKTSAASGPTRMSNGALVAPANPLDRAPRVYPVPLRLMLRSEKVATPPLTTAVRFPLSDAPLVPVPVVIDTVTLPTKPVTGFPTASRTCTWTGGAIAVAAVEVVGSAMKTSWAAAPATMSKESLVTAVRPDVEAESRYPTPILSMLSVEYEATPEAAVAVVIPDRMAPPVPVPVPIATLMEPAKPVDGLLRESRAVTLTAGAMATPATDVPGCTVNPRWVAGPGTMSNFVLSVGVNVPEAAWSR